MRIRCCQSPPPHEAVPWHNPEANGYSGMNELGEHKSEQFVVFVVPFGRAVRLLPIVAHPVLSSGLLLEALNIHQCSRLIFV